MPFVMFHRPEWQMRAGLVFSLIVHFTRFFVSPIFISGDAARVGLYALDFLGRGVWPFYIYSMFAPNPLLVYLQAPAFIVFGFTHTTLRGVAAVAAAFALPAVYLACREVFADQGRQFARRTGVIAMLGLALSPLFNTYYSAGDETPLLPLVELLAVASLWRGLRQGRGADFFIAGVFVGLSQYTYIVGRAFPVALGVALLLAWWPRRRAFIHGRGLVLTTLTFVILALPQWLLFLDAPYTFFARVQQVPGQFDLRAVMGAKLINQLMTLGVYWDVPHIPYLNRPMLNPVLFAGLLLALAVTLRSRHAAQIFVTSTAAVMLVPDLVTFENMFPSANRLTGAVPFIFMLAGMGSATLWQWLETRPSLPAQAGSSVLVAVLLAGAESQWDFTYRVTPRLNAAPGREWQIPLVEIAEADYIAAHRASGILVPSSEYQRAPLALLLANYFPERAGALTAPLKAGESVTVVSPAAPQRATIDGQPVGFIPDEWVLLKDGVAYFLPPLPGSVESLGSPVPLYTSNGALGATVFPARWISGSPQFTPVAISFENGLELVGYNATTLSPGRPITITLYWRPQRPVPEDVQLFTQILNRNNAAIVGVHDWPLHGAYRVRAWAPGEVMPLSYIFTVPDDAAPGPYRLITGVFDVIHQAHIPLSVGEDFATVAPLKIPLPPALAQPAHAVAADFGETIRLAGYKLDLTNQGLRVMLFWQATHAPPADYTVFVHVVDPSGQIAAQSDSQPLDGQYPTSIWSPGEKIIDERVISVPTGSYRIFVGLYRWETSERLPAVLNGERLPDDRLSLGEIQLP